MRRVQAVFRGPQPGSLRLFAVDSGVKPTQAMASEPIRVLIVDDHDLFRAGLATVLATSSDIEVVAQASRGAMGVRLAGELRPDVVLLDLRMPDLDGVEATQKIVDAGSGARVIVLTVSTDERDVARALLAGANGYLVKDTPMQDIMSAVRAASHGESWLSPRAATTVLDKLRRDHIEPSPGSPTELLSPREVEILKLVAMGLENAEIAAELNISPRTAKNHLSSILSKLGLHNRVQAAIYAVRAGIC